MNRGSYVYNSLKLDVPRFLDYVAWRELRVQRDQQQEELQRLALMVTPYKQTGLTVAEALERAKTQPSKLSVVTKIG